MSPNLHLQLLRVRPLFFFTAYWAVMLPVMVQLLPGTQYRAGATPFIWGVLLLPFALGASLAAVMHEAMHRPFAAVLPSARQRFLRSHAIAVAGAAAACALLGFLVVRSVPVMASASIIVAALTWMLPFEPGFRWAGSRLLAFVSSGLAVAAVMFSGVIKASAIAHPFASAVVALAAAAVNFAVAFSKARLRVRAMTPYTSYFSAITSPDYTARKSREALARKPASRRRWRRSSGRDSLVTWVRVALHERFGRQFGGWAGMMLMTGAVITALGLWFIERDPARFWGEGTRHFGIILIFALSGNRFSGLRPAAIYPLSRRTRATVTYASSAWHLGASFAVVLVATLIAAGVSARWQGLEFSLTKAASLTAPLLLGLPTAPLMQWAHLHGQISKQPTVPALLTLLAVCVPLSADQLIPASAWTSGAGLLTCALLIAMSQLAYYAALRRFYGRGDLLQRASTSPRLGLV